MKLKERQQSTVLFLHQLEDLINLSHLLVKLAHLIGWSVFERVWVGHFPSKKGHPVSPDHLAADLLHLEHMSNCPDEMSAKRRVENPRWQYFCDRGYLQHEPLAVFSSLSHWCSSDGRRRCSDRHDQSCCRHSLPTALRNSFGANRKHRVSSIPKLTELSKSAENAADGYKA